MSRVRIAVAGAGWWSTAVHLPALAGDREIELVGVSDPWASRRDAAMSEFDVPTFGDVTSMLESVQPDGVVIATPHHTHAALAEQCLIAGVSVLVEKPLATTAADAWRLVGLERRVDATVVAGLTYQFAACAPAVRAAVRGRIGEVTSVNAEFSAGTESLFATLDESGADLDDPGVAHGTTYSDPETGGGQAYTQLSHLLGGVMFATGQQATTATALMDRRSLRVDVVDAVAFRLEGGGLGVASSTGTTPAGVPVRHLIRVHGTRGMVEWDMLGAEAWIYETDGRTEHVRNPETQAAYASARVAPEFARVVSGESENPAPIGPAAASIALIEAAYRSAASGVQVEVEQGTGMLDV